MDELSLLQWPAMLVNILSVWLLTFPAKQVRHTGFLLSLLSNTLWVAWGWHTHALAVIVLQFALAALNIRGIRKTD
ncbi:MAG TPA: hypothetical protein VHB01_03655 [Nitrosospira sp.]|jgi:hypothetical protein|nr:hypothetical protein [Nitrosospira sp.]